MTTSAHPPLADVDAYPVPRLMLERVMKEAHTEEQAQRLLKEAKRMLYLCVTYNVRISPSLRVDDGWHAMLMFTRWYRTFASFIGAFVHHEPSESPPDGGAQFRNTKEKYFEHFGEEPDAWTWAE